MLNAGRGKLNSYLADMNEQAEELFLRLVEELAEKENIMETLKAENQTHGGGEKSLPPCVHYYDFVYSEKTLYTNFTLAG